MQEEKGLILHFFVDFLMQMDTMIQIRRIVIVVVVTVVVVVVWFEV